MMKKYILTLMAVILVLASGIPVLGADASYKVGPEVYGDAYCIMDAETGDVLCGRNAMGKYYPASITKILTALVVIENTEDLNETMVFSGDALYTITPSHSTLTPTAKVGEKMTVWDALCGLFLSSANECGNGLAEHVAGSMEAFAEMMNAKAAEIGATSSHFMNAHGFHHSKHYTNAYDMCLIMQEALKNETFRKLASMKTYTISATNLTGPRPLAMGHQMVVGNIPYEGVFAGKTGWTPYAGRTLVTAAEHNGRTVIIALMQSNDQYHYVDTSILLDYAYAVMDGKEEWNWEEKEETVWAAANVNLRGKATEHSDVRGSIPKGETATCLAEYAGWCKVEFKGSVYYAASEYLSHQDPSQPVETEPAETEPIESEPETTKVQDTEPVQTEPETEKIVPEEESSVNEGQILLAVGLIAAAIGIGVGGFVWYQNDKRGRHGWRRR